MSEQNPYAPPAYDPSPELATADLMPILQGVQFPLQMTFKIFTFAPTVRITDATGRLVLVVRQKFFKLKEHVEIFGDEARKVKVADIQADRIIDWSAQYRFTEPNGKAIGSTKRRGARSIWRATYDVFNPGDAVPDFEIHETNPWAKFFDGLVGQLPLIGLLTVYLFHPSYAAKRNIDGSLTMKITKQPAFLQGRFAVEKLGPATDRETLNLILSFFMLCLLERRRG
jgi:hypothetical protein